MNFGGDSFRMLVMRTLANALRFWSRIPRFGLLLATCWLCGQVGAQEIRFSRDVLPILSDTCFSCHGPDEKARQANLRLDSQAGAYGRGESGQVAVVPGDVQASEIVRRITSTNPDEAMPPRDALRQLTQGQIETLRAWVAQGAKWGKHWSYEELVPPKLPSSVAGHLPTGNAIDAFVRARLQSSGMRWADEATREALLRRVTLDLTGLPPTLDEIDSHLANDSPQAYEQLVDRLLTSKAYGERWAWEWLDAARYADTNGFQGDPERTMWPWRDWVVNAINSNMPYGQFTVEQLAGDLIPQATRDQKLASGFHRNNMHNGEGGRIAEETRVENIFDRVETTATIWLGSTFTCTRCHDHKYDPFTMSDYFGLYDIFNQMSETGAGRGGQAEPVLDFSTSEEETRVKRTQESVELAAKAVEQFELKKFPRAEGTPLTESVAINLPGNLPNYIARTEPSKRGVDQLLEAIGYFEKDGNDPDYVRLLKSQLAAVRARDAARSSVTKVMIMDQIDKPRETFVLSKGAYDKPTSASVVGAMPVSLRFNNTASAATARANRLELAQWLIEPQNPLTARVTVNRFWQAFFGIGLVKTTEDFGLQGERPNNPELLDWLAADFISSGWDVKSLHRIIVTSATYRQSAKVAGAALEADPENRLLARGPRFRMPSWMIRDVALATSGLYVDRLGGASVKPYQPPGIWEEATFGKKSYQQDHGESLYRRSLYTFWRRIVGPTMFFDNAARQTCSVAPVRTNTPLHALATLNDVTYVEAARALAERIMLASSTDASRIETAFRLATSRRVSDDERAILLNRLTLIRRHFSEHASEAEKLLSSGESPRNPALDAVEQAAMMTLCQLILNLDEALSK